jgi:hypothetical protein
MEWNDPNRVRVTASKDFIRLLLSNNNLHKAGIFDFAGSIGEANGDGIDDYYLRVLQDFVYVSDTTGLFTAAVVQLNQVGLPCICLSGIFSIMYTIEESRDIVTRFLC